MKNNPVFTTLITLRIVLPPIIFSVFHPFIAMLINECILDGVISPYHFFKKYVPSSIDGHDKLIYDTPLDMWGFANGLIPVLYKGSKFYNVFEGYRELIIGAFVWRFIGYIVMYKTKSWAWFLLFQNFYISTYLATGFCDFFNVKHRRKEVMVVSIIIFILREIYLVGINKNL